MQRQSTINRFWSKVDRSSGEDHCWPWRAGRDKDGYGRFWCNGKNIPAHVFAYETTGNKIPKGLLGCHSCDDPPCCNPNHVFPGTNADNAKDRDTKKRTARGERHGSQTHPERVPRGDRNGARLHPETRQGSKNSQSKLTEQDVREIKAALLRGEQSRKIAARYGVRHGTIDFIASGKAWSHII